MNKTATTSGSAEETTPLKAFGNALLTAGKRRVNLVKVSSISPAEAGTVGLPRLQPSADGPLAYAGMTSRALAEVVGSAVG